MDEREKLRKFRELDDAFAKALNEIETPAQTSPDDEHRHFEQRLRSLMSDFSQNDTNVHELLQTMLKLGRIA